MPQSRKKFAVIGLGRFGRAVARELFDLGVEVVGIDRDDAVIDQIEGGVTRAVALDARRKMLLVEHDVDKVDCAVVGIGENFEANVLVTSLLKGLGIPVVVTRSYTELQREILENIGATRVLAPEEDIGRRLAKNLVSSDMSGLLELPEGYVVRRVSAPEKLIGKTLKESKVRKRHLVEVVLIKRTVVDPETKEASKKTIVIPQGRDVVEEGDILGLIGKRRDIDKLV